MKKFELILDKYGVGLSVKDGQFYIRGKDSKQAIPPGKVRSITLAKSTNVTGAAIKLAMDSDIDIAFVERDGMPFARVWSSEFGSIAKIRRRQLVFSESPDGQQWIRDIIRQKIKNQMALIAKLAKEYNYSGPHVRQVRDKFAGYLLKLDTASASDADELAHKLRGWEANASRVFFKAIAELLPEKWRFEKRSKRPARDPFNAALNYCYGILYNHIESRMIRSGLDPHIGIFHVDQHKRPVLVFDMIERYRHWAEYPVIKSFMEGVFIEDNFEEHKGAYLLGRGGKPILIETYFSYMNERVKYDGRNERRMHIIKIEIEEFAQRMKNYTYDAPKKSGI